METCSRPNDARSEPRNGAVLTGRPSSSCDSSQTADDWDLESAALELRSQFDDVRLLHLLRARVAHAMLDRPTPRDLRALATLERALFAPRRAQALADTGSLAVVAP